MKKVKESKNVTEKSKTVAKKAKTTSKKAVAVLVGAKDVETAPAQEGVIDFAKISDEQFASVFRNTEYFQAIEVHDMLEEGVKVPYSYIYILGKFYLNSNYYYTHFVFMKNEDKKPMYLLCIYDREPKGKVKSIHERHLTGDLLKCCWGHMFCETQVNACKIFLGVDILDILKTKSV